MKNFLRVVRLTLRRRYTFAAAVACSLGVALFWGGNLALLKPVIDVVFSHGKKPHELADQKVIEAKEKLVEGFTREYLVTLLEKCNGNISQMARTAGIARNYVHRLVTKYGLKAHD